MNSEAVRQCKPLVECAMFELEAQLTTIVPGQSPCLRCLFPQEPPTWRRQFPVFGAVAGTVACMAAMEAIKILAAIGRPLVGRLLRFDLRDMTFHTLQVKRVPACPTCSCLYDSEANGHSNLDTV
jgi:molybdopterin-synthase adenylyltransferase